MLAKWFKRTGKRDEIFLADKFGIVMDGMQFKGIDSTADYCKRACEESLKKLGTDRIDLCMCLPSRLLKVAVIAQFIVSSC